MFMGISLWPKCTAYFHASEYMRCRHSEHLFDEQVQVAQDWNDVWFCNGMSIGIPVQCKQPRRGLKKRSLNSGGLCMKRTVLEQSHFVLLIYLK